MSTPAVHLDGITKRFPGVVANDDVDLTVERGSVHALLGENGAGKTTLMNVLYGLYRPNEGSVYVDGDGLPLADEATAAAGDDFDAVREAVQRDAATAIDAPPREFRSPADAIAAGIGMIHQHFMLVDPMTVAENVVLGNEPRKWGGLATDRERARREVAELSERYGFAVDPDVRIEDASVGVQQRVEILKALYRGADVLVLDEPTAVLTPQEVEDLFAVIEELTDQGKTVIFITHKLGEAMGAADRITVLRDGKNVGTVAADDTTREELAELMVGREVILETKKEPTTPGDVVLDVDGLRVTDAQGVDRVRDVSLTVRESEVLGIAGVDGNGQSELVEAITGLQQPDAGTVTLAGTDVTDASRRDRIAQGMAYVPEDRQERGLVMDFDLVENGLLGSQHLEPFAEGGRIDWEHAEAHAEGVVSEFDVRPGDVEADAHSLSGGNQQKFVVGRELLRDPALVVAAQPTRGVDIGSIEFIHERLLDLRREGKAVLLVSSKLDEVRQLSDRLAVVHEGEFVDVVDPDRVTEEQLGLLMAGEQPDDAPSIGEDGAREATGAATTDAATAEGGDR